MKTLCLLGLMVGVLCGAEPRVAGDPDEKTGLYQYEGCTLVPEKWADGDSFSVRFPDGKAHTIRLYGVDCFETSGEEKSDARRLGEQRRYFGIEGFGGNPKASNDKAKELGRVAKTKVVEVLKGKFTVHTSWADARGSEKFKRFYGFVTMAEGTDLGETLVEAGLARAYGVYRRRPDGTKGADYREHLRDIELRAAIRRVGAWKFTDWETLPEERQKVRDELAELEAAKDDKKEIEPVDPNTATRDELMTLPGIGEVKANGIIEGREEGKYGKVEDLRRVSGIGEKTVEKLKPFLKFGGE